MEIREAWRVHRVAAAIGLLGLLVAAPAVLAAAHVRNPWVLGGAAVLAGLVAVSGASLQGHYRHLAQRRNELLAKAEDGCLVRADGHLPLVRDISDPVLLGVHNAVPALGSGLRLRAQDDERVPVYLPRDFDVLLRERVASGGVVLLVGDSTAGKTRAAAEAMRATLSDHVLVCPGSREAVGAAVAHAARTKRCVLGPDHPSTLASRIDLALVLWKQGKLLDAEAEHRAVLDVRSSALGTHKAPTMTSPETLCLELHDLGMLAEAEAEHRACLDIDRVWGREENSNVGSRNNLASVMRGLTRLSEADADHRSALDARMRHGIPIS